MDDTMIIAQLRDIRGPDVVSGWPLAPGWWVLLLGGLLLGLLLWRLFKYLQRDWRDDARRRLLGLRRQLGKTPGKQVLTEFSELLRRVAMARYGRGTCAGLFGQDWLNWLKAHDPKRFDWPGQADLLLNFAYAPPNAPVDEARLRRLIKALRPWVDADLPKAADGGGTPAYLPAWCWQIMPKRWRARLNHA